MTPALALAAAAGSAVCYGAGSVLEQIGVRRESGVGALDVRLLLRLTRRLSWVAGAGVDLAGWLLSLAALRTLPLFAVQAAVAGSVGVTAALSSVVLGVRPARRQGWALAVLAAGLVVLGVTAAPEGSRSVGAPLRALIVTGPVVLAAAAAAAGRSAQGDAGAARLGMLAGLAFSGTAISGRILHVPIQPLTLAENPLTWALIAYGLLGTLLFAVALQRGSATAASAATFAAETVVPAMVGVFLLGDHARPAVAPLALAGFLTTVAATLTLARDTDRSRSRTK